MTLRLLEDVELERLLLPVLPSAKEMVTVFYGGAAQELEIRLTPKPDAKHSQTGVSAAFYQSLCSALRSTRFESSVTYFKVRDLFYANNIRKREMEQLFPKSLETESSTSDTEGHTTIEKHALLERKKNKDSKTIMKSIKLQRRYDIPEREYNLSMVLSNEVPQSLKTSGMPVRERNKSLIRYQVFAGVFLDVSEVKDKDRTTYEVELEIKHENAFFFSCKTMGLTGQDMEKTIATNFLTQALAIQGTHHPLSMKLISNPISSA